MTPSNLRKLPRNNFASDLDALIAIARHEGISDQELTTLMREATDVLVPAPSSVSRIVRSRSKKQPRPTPAIAVPTVVWRRQLRRWRTRPVQNDD